MPGIRYLPGTRIRDLTGERFGRLYVQKFNHYVEYPTRKIAYFKCICLCGHIKIVANSHLTSGQILSCGCLKSEKLSINILDRTINSVYKNYEFNAYTRGYKFTITKGQFKELIFSKCFYCGKLPVGTVKNPAGAGSNTEHLAHNGIDRVDNNYGYIPGNCVPCCSSCNFVKKAVPVSIMIKALQFLGYTVTKEIPT